MILKGNCKPPFFGEARHPPSPVSSVEVVRSLPLSPIQPLSPTTAMASRRFLPPGSIAEGAEVSRPGSRCFRAAWFTCHIALHRLCGTSFSGLPVWHPFKVNPPAKMLRLIKAAMLLAMCPVPIRLCLCENKTSSIWNFHRTSCT